VVHLAALLQRLWTATIALALLIVKLALGIRGVLATRHAVLVPALALVRFLWTLSMVTLAFFLILVVRRPRLWFPALSAPIFRIHPRATSLNVRLTA
jgi:hypothetical protein